MRRRRKKTIKMRRRRRRENDKYETREPMSVFQIEYYDIDANLFHRILFMSSRQQVMS